MTDEPTQPAKKKARAEILMPGKDGYERAGFGGETAFKKPAKAKPAPAPKPTAAKPFKKPTKEERDKTPTAVSPARQSEALAETVMTSILDRLTAEASRNGGMLSVDDLHALDGEFKKKTQALQQVFQASFDEYVRAREQSAWDKSREFPFGRLLVSQYSPAFVGKSGKTLKEGAVSRRIIPGFFVATNMMLGPEFVEGAQQLCRGVVDRLKANGDKEFSWDMFYKTTEAKEILLDALVAIAPFFEQADRRLTWMADVINSHLEPVDPESMEGDDAENWFLDDQGLREVLKRLFKPLRDALANPASRSALTVRHGDDDVAEISTTLDRLLGL